MSTLADSDSAAEKRAAMARALAHGGFDDVLVLDRESADAVLTDRRREIASHLTANEVASVRALARALDRDKAAVSRDLATLAASDVVEFSTEGSSKVPRLKHETVVVEPIV